MPAVPAVPLGWVAPFVALLLCIAVLPLATPHWWHGNRNKALVAGALALPVAVWLLSAGHAGPLGHALHEYVSFVILLGALFAVSGGILLEGDLRPTPRVNAAILAVGAAIASFVGTTGASMLLIRPLLRINGGRTRVVHTVVFFILVVSNCGGCLTPLGDPPLFLGYLRGVPFEWTFTLWPHWLAVNGTLLAIYLVWDALAARGEVPAALQGVPGARTPLRVRGGVNFALLLGIIGAVALLTPNRLGVGDGTAAVFRDGALVAIAGASMALTRREIREANRFDWFPIAEVAALFAGIFVTMVPALLLLRDRGMELGLSTPRQYFWATGVLSAFLDNAPTYVTFTTVAASVTHEAHPAAGVTAENLATLLRAPGGEDLLRAISLGAVFLGAATYIGNGPNFMVKSIAEASGVKMPGFFGYFVRASVVLVPVLLVVKALLG